MEPSSTCPADLGISAIWYIFFGNPGSIGFDVTCGLYLHFILETKKYIYKVICVGRPILCLSVCTYMGWKLPRKIREIRRLLVPTEKVFCLEASPRCISLFENFFYSACPWYRYELQWIQKHTSVSFSPPVLVVFRSISRLKDEVDATLENVTYTGDIMLIVMHNCEPTLRPTKLLCSCEDKRVVSFTNILTWNGSIYACLTNKKAKNDIKLYLSSKSKLTMD